MSIAAVVTWKQTKFVDDRLIGNYRETGWPEING